MPLNENLHEDFLRTPLNTVVEVCCSVVIMGGVVDDDDVVKVVLGGVKAKVTGKGAVYPSVSNLKCSVMDRTRSELGPSYMCLRCVEVTIRHLLKIGPNVGFALARFSYLHSFFQQW